MEKVRFSSLQNCIRLSNDEIEIAAALDFGPRILNFSFIGGENIFGLHPEAKVETELGIWKPYGGHRLWIAPENMPKSYVPDDKPVEYFFDEEKNSLRLLQEIEPITATQKEMTVKLAPHGSGVFVNHKITNFGTETVELSAWAITIMRDGGEAFIPNEPFAAYGAETLLPVRNLAVWSYTDLSDSRLIFTDEFIRIKVDKNKSEPQKIGVLNRQGWVQYNYEDLVFVKRFNFLENAVYPDMNSNTEIYTAGSFVEIESLSPLKKLAPGGSVEHSEYWELKKQNK